MPRWKLNIFINAIRARMVEEDRTAEDLIGEYTKLTEEEVQEILDNLK